mgnify:CR=1 FL=1
MKTWQQFREDMDYAQETLVLEAQGFGEVAKRRRKKRRFQSKRDEKVQALKSRPELWRGLEEVEYA